MPVLLPLAEVNKSFRVGNKAVIIDVLTRDSPCPSEIILDSTLNMLRPIPLLIHMPTASLDSLSLLLLLTNILLWKNVQVKPH